MSQELIAGFVKEMRKKGHTVMKCPECLGALWLEGEQNKEVMLMRYSTIWEGECMKCREIKEEMCGRIEGEE